MAKQPQPQLHQAGACHAGGIRFGVDRTEQGQEVHLHKEAGLSSRKERGGVERVDYLLDNPPTLCCHHQV